jgi:DNA-3-methyladenine glycosylase
MPRLKRNFFLQPTVKVAQELLGKFLVHKGKRGKIVETEAYLGVKDKACHSCGGRKTGRTKIMFEEGGKAYPYFVYGVHWLFNITTGRKNVPEAVLIRALDIKNTDGPAKLSKFMKIDRSVYGKDLCKAGSSIYVLDSGGVVKKSDILTTPRIGVDYAGPYWSKKKLRYILKGDKSNG